MCEIQLSSNSSEEHVKAASVLQPLSDDARLTPLSNLNMQV